MSDGEFPKLESPRAHAKRPTAKSNRTKVIFVSRLYSCVTQVCSVVLAVPPIVRHGK